jgi:hypothetical protein
VDDYAFHVFALVPYFSKQSPVRHRYLCLAVGVLASRGVAVSWCIESFVWVVASICVCACKCAPVSVGGVVDIGVAVLFAAFVFVSLALSYLCANGICVHRRSWSES